MQETLVSSSTACLRPWVRPSEIDSYSAKYLLIGQSYSVLKAWKRRGGLLFDRLVFQSDLSLTQKWKETQAQAIVPIPQYWSRSWRLNGSPTEKIAIWMKSQIQLPIINAIQLRTRKSKRQAERSLNDRLTHRIPFSIDPRMNLSSSQPLKRVILVDDFMTTGRTLGQAASLLRASGICEIHVFCLGIRPARLNS